MDTFPLPSYNDSTGENLGSETSLGKGKVFVIGRNKSGTTSLAHTLASLGYRVADQEPAELLIEDWAKRDFHALVDFCRTADAFQDVPFSMDYTYQVLDYAFPESKFILTVRNSSEEWYESLVRYHTKLLNKNHHPMPDDLREFTYRKTGWLWRMQEIVYGVDDTFLYDKEIYTRHYEEHNRRVLDYFKYRPKDLLVLNLANSGAAAALGEFLGIDPTGIIIPHLNSSRDSLKEGHVLLGTQS